MNELEALKQAQDLSENGDYDNAAEIAYRYLKDKPNDPAWLTLMTYVLLATNKAAIAYSLAKRVTEVAPRQAHGWLNMGRAASDLWLQKEAIRYYKKGIKLAKDDKQRSVMCVNLGSVLVDNGSFDEGEKYCREALALNPDSVKGRANLGFCQLAKGNWKEGWHNYGYCVGSEWRPQTRFNDREVDWDGKSKGTIAIWGEQGLGDEISFSSMWPDMVKWCKDNDSTLIAECDPRLGTLFKRTFPGIEIQPTRGRKQVDWRVNDVDYSVPSAQLGEHFRQSAYDFPGTAYLVPDPDRVLQWKALFKSKKKPVIGLAWRGGIPKTAAKFRQLDLEQLLPILESVDAHWVSLQYKRADKEIASFKKDHPEIDIVEYPHATLTADYDDTVAMVAALDHVVAMHTTIVHVAGGLEIPCWTFVPRTSQWRYGCEGEDFAWCKSVRILRQIERGKWKDLIAKTAKELRGHFSDRNNVPLRKPLPKKNNGRRRHKNTHGNAPSASNGASVPTRLAASPKAV